MTMSIKTNHKNQMTKIWYEDWHELYEQNQYLEVLPASNMSFEEQLNAIFRFFIYLGVILALVKMNYRYIFMIVFGGILTIILYEYEKSKRARAEKFLEDESIDVVNNGLCTRSTVENPFMNPSIVDITENPTKAKACRVTAPEVQEKIYDNFNARLFRDVNDVFDKNASQREFYTVPNTMIPNDQGAFAQWLYGTGKTCKEGNGMQCWENLPDDNALDSDYMHRRYTKTIA